MHPPSAWQQDLKKQTTNPSIGASKGLLGLSQTSKLGAAANSELPSVTTDLHHNRPSTVIERKTEEDDDDNNEEQNELTRRFTNMEEEKGEGEIN